VVASPLIVIGCVVIDVVQRRSRLPTLRVALFLLQYVVNDSIEIVLAPVYWVMAGLGTRLAGPASIRRHERLQRWSIAVLARRADRLLGIRLDVDDVSMSALTPGPVIVLCRHVNIVDATLPTLLYQRLGYRSRGVIMAEMLADPGFDLIYARTGSVFIPRDNGPEALEMVSGLAGDVDDTTAVVIFPEGRLFRRDRLDRATARLRADNPDRAERLGSLAHVLPPRPGGLLTLLHALPGTDVVVIAHAGLDEFGSFAELAAAVPLPRPIRVAAWRTPAAEVPGDALDQIAWLDTQWRRVDAWIGEHVETR
jgi:1-acyl-sn-glycerol-3-phosphate acyltransferase